MRSEMQELMTISGTVEAIIFANEENGYTVLDLDMDNQLVTAVGLMGEVHEGEELVLHGNYVNSPKHGRQFSAEIIERALPKTKEAIQRYLASGVISGVGPSMARKIVTAFGERSLEVIETKPEQLSALNGITTERALKISADFKKIMGLRKAMTHLSAYGIQPITVAAAWKKYEGNTVEIIQSNPYVLCEYGIDLHFDEADRFAGAIGIPRDSDERIYAGLIWTLRMYALEGGNTCVPESELSARVCTKLGVDERRFWSALQMAAARDDVVINDIYGAEYVFLTEYYRAECYVAERLSEMIKRNDSGDNDFSAEIAAAEWEQGIQYENLQREAIKGCMNNHIFILTGGPGTGKTTTLNGVISLFKQRNMKIKLAAPTGRAAKRMSDLTGEQAQTIHRLLEVDFNSQGNGFRRNAENPLSCDVLIIDEVSMVDIMLFSSLLAALRGKTKLILVGDSNQLPSVGAGNVLRDLIDGGRVPMIELKEIFRQAAESLIVTNAHRIVGGEMPVLNDRTNDFFFMPTASDSDTVRLVVELCRDRLPKAYEYSPFDDIQVLCPSRKGDAGTAKINAALQLALNPPAAGRQELRFGDALFRTGDKIMQTKNDYDIEWERGYEKCHGIFNGDIGVIRTVDKANNKLNIDFEGRIATYDIDMLKKVEHAYAITIHKSQGSEYPCVIIALPEGMDILCYRNLLYTAVTRAKSKLIVIGSARKVQTMVQNGRRAVRYSCLKNMLEDYFV